MIHDVFISYSAEDKPTADAVVAGLENQGIRCWIAPRDIGAGKEYGAEIIEGITGCQIMVLIFSKRSNKSNQVVREVERAVSAQKIIIPFRIENLAPTGSMEYFLSLPHWLDAYTEPLKEHVDELAATVSSILSGRPMPPPPPAGQPAGKRRSPWAIPGIAAAVVVLAVFAWQASRLFTARDAHTAPPAAAALPVASPAPVVSSKVPAAPSATPRPEIKAAEAADLLVKQGIDLYNQGNYDGALERENQALDLDPGNVEAHFHRGNAYKAKKDIPAAINDYNAALALRPGYANVYYNRANAYLTSGEDGPALADFNRALELDPKNWLAFNNRGCLYNRQGAYDLAIADFSSALALKPDYAQAQENREAAYRGKAASGKPSAGSQAAKPTPAPQATALFDNGNIYATLNGPTRATMFTINTPCMVTTITTYHWNSARGAEPGTIRLVQQGGKVFGPWKAAGLRGQGGVPNATWIVKPGITIAPGTYTIIDSSPKTWSHNAASQGSGISRIEGFETN